MSDKLVWDSVVDVIRETFGDDQIPVTRETSAADIPEWDSVSNVELLVNLEHAFEVRFYTGEIASLRNVGELADVISARVRDGHRRAD
ncbi:MAG TPA: acyl carrier protein [Gemmatimonadaceae bacterium]|jgi:acyl carrier protein|nr:acyl carrier protein [Gemmatimonadaceae bacterium]